MSILGSHNIRLTVNISKAVKVFTCQVCLHLTVGRDLLPEMLGQRVLSMHSKVRYKRISYFGGG